jgi:regulatory protein spx
MPAAKKRATPAKGKPRAKAPFVDQKPKTAHFFEVDTCSTCRKARGLLKKRGFRLNIRDLKKNKLSSAELEKLIGERDHEEFLNSRSRTYQEQEMDEKPPSRRAAISWMARDPGLIRRPIVVAGGRVVVGFDEKGMAKL